MEPLYFSPKLLQKPSVSGIDAQTTLRHFAIITLRVAPERCRPLIHPRFTLDTISLDDGSEWALLSVVPFIDQDFRAAAWPSPKWRFGQTNYRIYVRDQETDEHVVWFLGTALDSIWNAIPRWLWRLPWHRARIRFDCDYDAGNGRYSHYRLQSRSRWAPATVALADSGQPPTTLAGFPNLETGLVLLTHPLRGFFYRRDGRLGSYRVWHPQIQPTAGRLIQADFPLLRRLGLLTPPATNAVHSVLLQHQIDFTIFLPPSVQ